MARRTRRTRRTRTRTPARRPSRRPAAATRRPRRSGSQRGSAEKTALIAAAAAALWGLAEKNGWTAKIPALPYIGVPGTAALALYAYQRLVSRRANPTLAVATAALAAIGAYRAGTTIQSGGQVSGDAVGDAVWTPQEIAAIPTSAAIARPTPSIDPAVLRQAAEILSGLAGDEVAGDEVAGDDLDGDDLAGDDLDGDDLDGDDLDGDEE